MPLIYGAAVITSFNLTAIPFPQCSHHLVGSGLVRNCSTAAKLDKLALRLTNQHRLSFLAAARNDRLLLDLSGSVDLVGIDDDGHSVEPHDFPDP